MRREKLQECSQSCSVVSGSLETAAAVEGEPIDGKRKMDKLTCQCPSLALRALEVFYNDLRTKIKLKIKNDC